MSREAVVDTVFSALFSNKPNSHMNYNTGSESDEPNEAFVKSGLTSALFKDGLNHLHLESKSSEKETLEQFITPQLIHTVRLYACQCIAIHMISLYL